MGKETLWRKLVTDLISDDPKELVLILPVVIMALCFGKKTPMFLVIHTEVCTGETTGCLGFVQKDPRRVHHGRWVDEANGHNVDNLESG